MNCSNKIYKGESLVVIPFDIEGWSTLHVDYFTDGKEKVTVNSDALEISGGVITAHFAPHDLDLLADGVLRYTIYYTIDDTNYTISTNSPYILKTPMGYNGKTAQYYYDKGFSDGLNSLSSGFSANYFYDFRFRDAGHADLNNINLKINGVATPVSEFTPAFYEFVFSFLTTHEKLETMDISLFSSEDRDLRLEDCVYSYMVSGNGNAVAEVYFPITSTSSKSTDGDGYVYEFHVVFTNTPYVDWDVYGKGLNAYNDQDGNLTLDFTNGLSHYPVLSYYGPVESIAINGTPSPVHRCEGNTVIMFTAASAISSVEIIFEQRNSAAMPETLPDPVLNGVDTIHITSQTKETIWDWRPLPNGIKYTLNFDNVPLYDIRSYSAYTNGFSEGFSSGYTAGQADCPECSGSTSGDCSAEVAAAYQDGYNSGVSATYYRNAARNHYIRGSITFAEDTTLDNNFNIHIFLMNDSVTHEVLEDYIRVNFESLYNLKHQGVTMTAGTYDFEAYIDQEVMAHDDLSDFYVVGPTCDASGVSINSVIQFYIGVA